MARGGGTNGGTVIRRAETALRVVIAVQQAAKYASAASGDTVEVVQRPGSALSVLLVDGQGSGPGAKALSLLLTGRAASLVRDGARDQTVLDSAHDFLLAHRNGLVSATVDLVTIDPVAGELRIARHALAPAVVGDNVGFRMTGPVSGPIGRWQVEPAATFRTGIVAGTTLVVTSDGVAHAGDRRGGSPLDLAHALTAAGLAGATPGEIGEFVMGLARDRDHGRPADDMTVVVVGVRADADPDRSMTMRVSLPVTKRGSQ